MLTLILSPPPPLSLSLSLLLILSHTLSYSPTKTLSHSIGLSFSLSLYSLSTHSLSLSRTHFLTHQRKHSFIPSFFFTLVLTLSHTVHTLYLYLPLFLRVCPFVSRANFSDLLFTFSLVTIIKKRLLRVSPYFITRTKFIFKLWDCFCC